MRLTPSHRRATTMVARVQKRTDSLVVTLTDLIGRVLFQENVGDGSEAAQRSAVAIAARDPLQAGDLLRVTVARNGGEIHRPRETD
jgi:hypothetical protein